MKRFGKRLALAGLIALGLSGVGLLYLWKHGTPSGDPDWSPNRRYYVQHYVNWSPRMFMMRMPGDGGYSDGYVRVYDHRGRLLWERYFLDNHYVELLWAGKTLWVSAGIGREHSVTLPTSSE